MKERTPEEAASLHARYYAECVRRGIHPHDALELTRSYIFAMTMQQLPPNEPWRG